MRYWLRVVLALLGGTAVFLYGRHLVTGYTPPAIAVGQEGVPIYWAAVVLVAAVLLAYLVADDLVGERQEQIFKETIPPEIAGQPLPLYLLTFVPRYGHPTVGDLLFAWGRNPHQWGLQVSQLTQLGRELGELEGVDEAWVVNPPWRPWHNRHLLAILPGVLFWGLIGARLYHVFAPAPSNPFSTAEYLANPWLILSVWNGGWGFYGALLGGGVSLAVYGWRHNLPTLAWADRGVIGLALGQAIGRWGNFFNQELYGTPTNLPWAVHISPPYRLSGLEEVATYHPTFLYESLWCAGLFGLLWWLHGQKRLGTGGGVAVYGVGYALGRLLIEAVRMDVATAVVAGISLPVASWVSLALVVNVPLWWFAKSGRKS